VEINGTLIASHSFGSIGGTVKKAVLTGTYTPATTGIYTLDIRNYRKNNKTTKSDLYNYIDEITLAPTNAMLGVDGEAFSAFLGSTRNFELSAGPENAGKNYWLWVGFSETYPGIMLSGVDIPLNHDVLVDLGLAYPGLPGTGFFGVLDGAGNATASMYWKPKMTWVGLTLYYSYVVLSPGGSLPVLAASNPVNVSACMYE
jgi:hypothetical protein